MKFKTLLFATLFTLSQLTYAGGDYHFIQIKEIKTLSNREHHIIFTLLERENMDWYRENVPIYNCDSVTLKVELREWELKHKILLFFDNLFNPMINQTYLNEQINKLKEQINKPIVLSDVEAFYYLPNNNCELLSKTIQVSYVTNYITNQSSTPFLQPIRHNSRPENRPKKLILPTCYKIFY